jgi:hypothetical protein
VLLGDQGTSYEDLLLRSAESSAVQERLYGACYASEISGLQEYDVVAQNNPIEFDAYSCGVYVCWMFIRHAIQGLRVDMTAASLPRRRFELFFYLRNNRLLTAEPATATAPPATDDEEKPPPPSEDQDDEEVPATQVAQ